METSYHFIHQNTKKICIFLEAYVKEQSKYQLFSRSLMEYGNW